MATNRDQQRETLDSTEEILVDWNLSDTCDYVVVEELGPNPRSGRQRPDRELPSHRIDRTLSCGSPHRLNPTNRHSDTALFGAFDIHSQMSTQGGDDGHATRAGGLVSENHRGAPSRAESVVQRDADGGQSNPRFPKPGECLDGFRIILELGRGAFARVYLAEEINLGCRQVAIKVSRPEGDEPQILAKLQHTHIVPVLSVHTDPISGYRILCMPYFGGANLAEVLESAVAESNSVAARTGHSLIQALDRVSHQHSGSSIGNSQPGRGSSLTARTSRLGRDSRRVHGSVGEAHVPAHLGNAPAHPFGSVLARIVGGRLRRLRGDMTAREERVGDRDLAADSDKPSRRFLQGANGVQAAVWIVARLAEGLDHAHARGLLHRDVKPSNVLIAADGTPMLLDFNLSVEQALDDEEEGLNRAMVGGTLPYMSPEHLDAFNPKGTTRPEQVDGRSDIYAMGLILFEMIAGRHPFPEPPSKLSILETIRIMLDMRRQVPSLRAARPDVPWSLDALTAKCLDPNPDRRYALAKDLAEDLRRFLDNLPMKHCPDPSPKERFGKWVRRHPAITSSTSVALFSLALILVLGLAVSTLYGLAGDVAARLRLQVFQQGFADSQFWLNTQSDRIEHMKKGLLQSQKTLDDAGFSEDGRGMGIGWISRLPAEEREQVYEQIVELCLLDARAGVKVAEKFGTEGDRRLALERAVRLTDRAQRLIPVPTSALFSERARFLDALGYSDRAEQDRRQAASIPCATSYDYLLLGISLMADGKSVDAEALLKEAIRRDVTSFWAWFSLGHCQFHQGRFADAVASFTACVVRGPKFAWAHFNLGLALAKSGRLTDAKAAYDRAIELDPDLPEARIDRGLVELELNLLADAREDLENGIAAGRDEVGVLAALGETLARMGRNDEADLFFSKTLKRTPNNPNVYVARGMTRLRTDLPGAMEDFTKALEFDPNHAPAHYGLARILRSDDPSGALSHLDGALKSDPNLLDAIQLRALIRARLADPATIDDVDRLIEKPTPHRLYNASCALAVFSEQSKDSRWINRSLDLLVRAVRMGFPIREAETDPDLRILHKLSGFQSLVSETKSK